MAPSPQTSTLPLTRASLAAFPGAAALQSRGLRPGSSALPRAVRMSLHARGSQSSTSHVCCRTAQAFLYLLKRSFGVGPFLGLWACMFFAFIRIVPCMRNQHLGTTRRKQMHGRCNLSQLNVLFADGKMRKNAYTMEAALPTLVLWPHFWVQNLALQNTNRSYSTQAASVLLPLQADSSTQPRYCM